MEETLADRVREVLSVDADAFAQQAAQDAEVVKSLLREGAFDNHRSVVGLEYEFYAAADGRWAEEEATDCTLMRVPRRLFDLIDFEKELGLHNAEMTTSPQPFNGYGMAAQAAEVRSHLQNARDLTKAEGMRLVSDGIWTIPPAGETAREYLTDSVVDDGVRVAVNMSDAVRYHAMSNSGAIDPPMAVDAPHVDLEADTVMPESLITSIQPHYQMSRAADLPRHHTYALRIAGPLLALGVNAPFFPPDLYADGVDAETILADSYMENRIAVFESVLNAGDAEKVTFPEDVETVEQTVDRIAGDDVVVPIPVEEDGDRFDDQFPTFRAKHGTYWRWVRPVFGGATRSGANARIEFRPLPGQPTVSDTVAFLAAFAGLMEQLPRQGHPLDELDWADAESNFYAAMREGLDADLRWITTDGEPTGDLDEIYDDLLANASAGLQAAGCSEAAAEEYLAPLRYRVDDRVTPASWKVDRVRSRVADGESFDDAVTATKREYVHNQSETLLQGTFANWD
ncbi:MULTISPECIES: hypothetical protein [Halolamina]|uniref:Gamma-glutamyl:cysteine ligase YbdK, ATP-grasp superfamily n=1 Tax=Halolamina pelagica TaxID=699431 RepID=A0A1I5VD03_9EURY|nr:MULTISPECIES: hypothetical protein [Halolamina]NHX37709.1 hypothetical protein [Halolamina sp. R1-12]SFQ04796.1 hypothetical protein SAMN05216277_11714 [Halolamina pelagica]